MLYYTHIKFNSTRSRQKHNAHPLDSYGAYTVQTGRIQQLQLHQSHQDTQYCYNFTHLSKHKTRNITITN